MSEPETPENKSKRGRKKKKRNINYTPALTIRQPTDGPKEEAIVKIGHDEVEALRLKHINGLGVVKAAEQMGISKSLFAKMHNEAVNKVTRALIHGRALHIELGRPEYSTEKQFALRELN